MGWDGHFISKFQDKEEELDFLKDRFIDGAKVLYATKVGTTWYLAVEYQGKVSAHVILTGWNRGEYLTKFESEDVGPTHIDAPMKLINMLSPTDSEWANEWRDRVRAKNGAKSMANRKSSTPIKVSEAKEIQFIAKRRDGSVFESTKFDKFNYQGNDVWAGKEGRKHYYPIRNDEEMKEHLQNRRNALKNGYDVSVKLQNPTGTYIVGGDNELNGRRTAPRKKTQKKSPFKLNVRGMF